MSPFQIIFDMLNGTTTVKDVYWLVVWLVVWSLLLAIVISTALAIEVPTSAASVMPGALLRLALA